MPEIQFSKVPCAEKAHSRKEMWSPTAGLSCSVELYINWVDRYKLIDDLAQNPYTRAWPYTVSLPEMDQLLPIPVEISFSPLRGEKYVKGRQGIDYANGIATVSYKMWTPTRERIEFQTTNVRLEPSLFKWSNPAFPDDGQQPKGLEGLTQTLRRLVFVKEFDAMLIDLPNNFYGTEDSTYDASSGAVGTVHDRLYVSSLIHTRVDGKGTEFVKFKENTLLMMDPVINDGPQFVSIPSDIPDETPRKAWRRGYRFKLRWLFRPEGHNKFWRPEKEGKSKKRGSWESLTLRGKDEIYEPFPELNHAPFLSNSESEKLQKPPVPLPLSNIPPLPVIS